MIQSKWNKLDVEYAKNFGLKRFSKIATDRLPFEDEERDTQRERDKEYVN